MKWSTHLLSFIYSKVEPKSYSEAVTHACWKEAVQEELQALVQNKYIIKGLAFSSQ